MNDIAQQLVAAAVEVSRRAYAPYSNFHVGAALLAENGEIITGCNVENASYGLTICAERNAIFAAVARGISSFKAVANVADGDAVAFPCGACRQVLSETLRADTPVYVASVKHPETIHSLTMGGLLPHAFKFKE